MEGPSLKRIAIRTVLARVRTVTICVALVLLLVYLAYLLTFQSKTETAFTSKLVNALDIAELSTSELIYNGIVDVYDTDGEKILYSIKYDSTVKVGIQMSDVRFETDTLEKTLTPILPDITIQNPVVDPSSIDFIPQNPKADLKDVISACRADAQEEAERSPALIQTAEENLKSIIEALLYPIAKDAGYQIKW